jgi:hypothetical protein
MAKEEKPQAGTGQPAEAAGAPGRQAAQVSVDDSNAASCYANFCRVTGSPEELIIDFGLNSQPVGVPKDPIQISQRLIVNFYTAKRLLGALSMAVQRHEAAFGVLETDIQKRLQPPPGSAS